MKKLLLILLPAALFAQQQAPASAKPAIPASWRDLKFPTLRQIQIA